MLDGINGADKSNISVPKLVNNNNENKKYNSIYDIEKDGQITREEQIEAIKNNNSWESMKNACKQKGLDFDKIVKDLCSKLGIIETDGSELSAIKADRQVQKVVNQFYIDFIDKISPKTED